MEDKKIEEMIDAYIERNPKQVKTEVKPETEEIDLESVISDRLKEKDDKDKKDKDDKDDKDDGEDKEIDKEAVKEAAMEIAKEAFEDEGVDEEIIDDMVKKAIAKAEDTEGAIGIIQSMITQG